MTVGQTAGLRRSVTGMALLLLGTVYQDGVKPPRVLIKNEGGSNVSWSFTMSTTPWPRKYGELPWYQVLTMVASLAPLRESTVAIRYQAFIPSQPSF
jgi:hypothetical protein